MDSIKGLLFSQETKQVVYKGTTVNEREPSPEEEFLAIYSCMPYCHKGSKPCHVFGCSDGELIKIPHGSLSGDAVLENEKRYMILINKNRFSGKNSGRIINII